MSDKIIDLGAGFWNIRGTFRLGGVLNIGTQCSLVKLASGRFVFLDSYTLTDDVRAQVMALTTNGQDVEAVLNLHPFHTVHCAQMAKDFPQATFYGSSRHHKKVSEVQWADDLVESDAVAERYPELKFSLSQGVHYIAPNEMIHAGSLLAFHPASKSLHVDDTFMSPPTKLLEAVLPELLLHPTTKKALKNEPNAGKEYCDWASNLADDWRDVRNFCAAHSYLVKFKDGEFEKALLKAIAKARPKLENA
ncbi:hypothetical protein [Psychrobacter cryohalolentis]|uniref:Metallo-beta-lactamase domain-containing protein n=1 Tax=Psychrobacter cryohalolentis (strain ATCC BAA-1226 / DSM 17306 / VKM B-2378 / K5) TaxID=335284 RepID=Q1QAK2_PSYCK|nr:hypothetical protein [Psychrobacter cryohalolentis]ABE75301.1 conserved hypothetical protein [Psychrobacter cryohalolentis K5]ASE25493.1 hypothetical protein CEP87_02460 [Psychrobacter cryohalolentis]